MIRTKNRNLWQMPKLILQHLGNVFTTKFIRNCYKINKRIQHLVWRDQTSDRTRRTKTSWCNFYLKRNISTTFIKNKAKLS
jgi:hypothetical protein